MNKKKLGFTLIELIVVISIIAIITVVGMVSYSGTNKKARDNKRVADVEKIRIALEMARQISSKYPAAVGNKASALVPTYLSSLPKDPKTGNDYYFESTNYTYSIGVSVEDAGSTNTSSYDCGSLTCNYKVINP